MHIDASCKIPEMIAYRDRLAMEWKLCLTHVRVHPLLEWTERNIWEYIEQERISTVSLYYDRGEGTRYRSLGCAPCTAPIHSNAANPSEIGVELTSGALKNIAERSGRAQDKDNGGGLETLRRDGSM